MHWGRAAMGLQCRLTFLPDEWRPIPRLDPSKDTQAILEVRNVSDKPITLTEQNTSSGRRMVAQDWLVGLELSVIDSQKGAHRFFRADNDLSSIADATHQEAHAAGYSILLRE